MRTIPETMAAQIASGATTFAHVWRFLRRDGALFGFTDHDRVLAFDSLSCLPMQGLRLGAIEKSAGLDVDSASVVGAFDSEAISEDDLSRGLWDGARVDLYRVDWRDPVVRVHLFAGRIGEVRRGARAFEAELRGLQGALQVVRGRVFSRYCDADLGDARCGKDLETSAFRGEGVVTEIDNARTFRADGLEAYADGWFTHGRLVWHAGGEGEVALHRSGADAIVELLDAPGAALSVGAGFSLYAGCDKSFAACRMKFANTLNFRGFPHMPGNDAVQAGPVAGETLDGGARRR